MPRDNMSRYAVRNSVEEEDSIYAPPEDDRSELLREAEREFSRALRADLYPQSPEEGRQEDPRTNGVAAWSRGQSQNVFEPALVEELEILLARAQAGEIVGIAAAVQRSDDFAEPLIVGRTNPLPLVGAMEAVKLTLLQDHISRET